MSILTVTRSRAAEAGLDQMKTIVRSAAPGPEVKFAARCRTQGAPFRHPAAEESAQWGEPSADLGGQLSPIARFETAGPALQMAAGDRAQTPAARDRRSLRLGVAPRRATAPMAHRSVLVSGAGGEAGAGSGAAAGGGEGGAAGTSGDGAAPPGAAAAFAGTECCSSCAR